MSDHYTYGSGLTAAARDVITADSFVSREDMRVLSAFFAKLRYVIERVEGRDVRFSPRFKTVGVSPVRNALVWNEHEDRQVLEVTCHDYGTGRQQAAPLFWRNERAPYRISWLCWKNYSMRFFPDPNEFGDPNGMNIELESIHMLVRIPPAKYQISHPYGVACVTLFANQHCRRIEWGLPVDHLETPGHWIDLMHGDHKAFSGWWTLGVGNNLEYCLRGIPGWTRHDLLRPQLRYSTT